MCFSPQRRAIFEHLNFKKWSENVSFLAFSLQNVLLATAACNFCTSQLQKVVRICSFVHFDLKMCFSPQRHANFQHLNFKKWSEHAVFCTFLTWKCASRHSGVQFLILLWPHDSAPAALTSQHFDPPDTRIIGKTQRFATSLTFGAGESSFFWLSRYCIFFLLTLLHLLTLLSSDFTSSLCLSSAFQLSTLSEVYYLNFLRLITIHLFYSIKKHSTKVLSIIFMFIHCQSTSLPHFPNIKPKSTPLPVLPAISIYNDQQISTLPISPPTPISHHLPTQLSMPSSSFTQIPSL